MPNVNAGAFKVLLRYLYAQELPEEEGCGEGLWPGEMAQTAFFFQMLDLYHHCVEQFKAGLLVLDETSGGSTFPRNKSPSATFPRRPWRPAARMDFYFPGPGNKSPSSTSPRWPGWPGRPDGFLFPRPGKFPSKWDGNLCRKNKSCHFPSEKSKPEEPCHPHLSKR